MKKAYLVTYYVQSRIIIDDEGKDDQDISEELHELANEKITDREVIDDYICEDNMDFEEDKEVPYGKGHNEVKN